MPHSGANLRQENGLGDLSLRLCGPRKFMKNGAQHSPLLENVSEGPIKNTSAEYASFRTGTWPNYPHLGKVKFFHARFADNLLSLEQNGLRALRLQSTLGSRSRV